MLYTIAECISLTLYVTIYYIPLHIHYIHIQAKELVEKAPTMVKEGLKKEDAENFKKLLTEAGAVIELV